jgi:hypothetical protein
MPEQFDTNVLNQLAHIDEIDIETYSSAGETHRIIIWVIVDDHKVYIRSFRGDRGRWYQEIKANPIAAIHMDGQRLPVRAVPVTDEETITSVSNEIMRKYHNSNSARSMVREEVLPTTLQLELV